MIIEIRAKNCYAFEEAISFSMKADMRNKKFSSNVHRENNFNVLKVAGIYGPNNAGKTCLVKCIRAIRDMLLNKKSGVMTNLFTDNSVCELGITFLHEGSKYAYDFRYDTEKEEYVYERFVQILKDQYANEKEEVWLLKDTENKEFQCGDDGLGMMMSALASNSLLIYLIDTSKFEKMDQMKKIVMSFANRIDIINMNNIPMQKTIDLLKNHNEIQSKVVDFIKNADLYLEDYSYQEIAGIKINKNSEGKPEEQVLDIPDNIMDQIRLVSVYKNVPVPSMLFDSTGTKK